MKKDLIALLCGLGGVALLLMSQFAAVFLAVLVLTVVSGGDLAYAIGQAADSTVGITLLSALLTVAVLALITALRRKPILQTAHLLPMKAVLWPVCLGLGLGLNLTVSVLLNTIPFPESWIDSYSSSSSLLSADNMPLYICSVVLVTPFAEELVFRRMAYGCFKTSMPLWAAALFSSVIFGVCHGTLLWMIYTVPLALIMCRVYDRCTSLWGSAALHIGFNAGSLLFEYLPGSTPAPVMALILAAGLAMCAVCAFLLNKHTPRPRAAQGDNTPMEN